jgi:Phage tail tube protein
MPGTQIFTYVNFGKETVRGTPVAPTRQFYSDGTGVLTPEWGQNFHESENTGRRYRTRRVTRMTEDVSLAVKTSSGVGYDDLVIPFSQIKGGATGVGGAADKTWTFTPSATAANSPESYSVDVGDDIQNWRCQYAMAQSFKITAGLGDVTQLEMDMFAQRAIKTAKATPAINAAIKIPGDLWTIKFAATIAGLAGASIQTNFLQGFELEVLTGLQWRHYMDGNLYGAQHVETDIAWTLKLTVESTALAVSEFYDKAVADTMDFIRLRAQGPVLGGTFYSAQIDMPVLYEEPEIISAEDNGVNIYTVTAHGSDDGTNGIIPVIVNSLAALP